MNESEFREALATYCKELGLDPESILGRLRLSITMNQVQAYYVTRFIPENKNALLDIAAVTSDKMIGMTVYKDKFDETLYKAKDVLSVNTKVRGDILTVEFKRPDSAFAISDSIVRKDKLLEFKSAFEAVW